MAIPQWLRRVTKRPDLDTLEVEAQCELPWDAIRGDGAVRDCQRCASAVYDLSKLSRRDIRRLVSRGEPFCGRIQRDDDGRLVTAPETRRPAVGLMAIPAWLGLVAAPQLTGRGCDAEPAAVSEPAPYETDELRVRASHQEAERRLAEEASRSADGTNFPGGVNPADLTEPLQTWDVVHEPVEEIEVKPEQRVRYRQRPTWGLIRTGDY